MTVEAASFISQLDATKPTATDPKSEGDDHLRTVKAVLRAQFPNFGAGAVNVTHTALNYLTAAVSADAAGDISIGGTSVSRSYVTYAATAIATDMAVNTGPGGGLLIVRGSEQPSGIAFSRVYLLAIRVSGGAIPDVAATLVASAGAVAPSVAFSVSGGFIVITPNASINLLAVSAIGV